MPGKAGADGKTSCYILPMPIAVTVKRTFRWILRVLENTSVVIQTSRKPIAQIQNLLFLAIGTRAKGEVNGADGAGPLKELMGKTSYFPYSLC